MSRQAFDRFLERLRDDARLRREALALARGRSAGHPASDLVALAAREGYHLTAAELGFELGDEALDAVTGGTSLLLPAVQSARRSGFFAEISGLGSEQELIEHL